MLERVAVDLAGRGDQEARALGLRQPERVVGAVGADLQRVQRQAQVVDRRGRRGEVVDEVDRLVDEVRLDDVDVHVHEALGVADVLDVRERARLEVVDADHAVAAREQLVAEVRSEESGAAGDQAGRHARQDTRRPPAARTVRRRCGCRRRRRGAAAVSSLHGDRPDPHATTTSDLTVAPIVGPDDPRRFTDSGIEIAELYTEADLPARARPRRARRRSPTRAACTARCTASRRGRCASTPATPRRRSPTSATATCSPRARPACRWPSTCRPSSAWTPTTRAASARSGRTGVAIDTIDDMRTAFDGIPLDQVSTSMTINAPAACLLLLYELVGEEQGVPSEQLRGTTQNDVLKEYIARGNYIYPPEPTMRLTTDLFQYCHERVPRWNTISISGYHFREKGCSAVQEVAFTLSSGHRLRAGGDRQGPRRRRLRAAPGVLLQRPQQRLPGGREVPRGAAHVGAHHDASASARRTRRRRCCASTRRPAA